MNLSAKSFFEFGSSERELECIGLAIYKHLTPDGVKAYPAVLI